MDNLPISEQELAGMDLICRAATPVWNQPFAEDLRAVSKGDEWSLLALDKDDMAVFDLPEDATFACSARQNMPRLIAEVRRQREEIAALEQQLRDQYHE